MPIKTRSRARVLEPALEHPEWTDSTTTQREHIDSEGYIYHYGPNETRNFADDGRAAAVVAFKDDGVELDDLSIEARS